MASLSSAFVLLMFVFLSSICNAAEQILYSGERIPPGGTLTYGTYELTMQRDCNLVLTERTIYQIWATNTGGLGSNCSCALEADGNLVIYRRRGVRVWASNTSRSNGEYALVLKKDRNVVIYGKPIWDSDSAVTKAKKNK